MNSICDWIYSKLFPVSFLSMVFIPEYEICYYQIKKKIQTTSSKRQSSCRLHEGLMTSVTSDEAECIFIVKVTTLVTVLPNW